MKYALLLAIPQDKLDADDKESIREILTAQPKKNFALGKEYGRLSVSSVAEQQSPIETAKALIYGMLSKPFKREKDGTMKVNFKPLKHALRCFEAGKIRKAREYVQGIGPGKVYSMLKNEISRINNGDVSAVDDALAKIKNEIIAKGRREKIEPISDMVATVEGMKKSEKYLDMLIFKMQDADIADLFDNRTLHCCAFYPDGANCNASIGYLKDPDIGLLQAKACYNECGELKEAETSATAILVNAKNKDDENVLLVDSVEAGDLVSRLDKPDKYNQEYLDAIISVAKYQNAKKIIFNTDAANSAPRSFNEFLAQKGLKKEKSYLKKRSDTDKQFYLEAFGGWAKPEGKVNGYVLKIE